MGLALQLVPSLLVGALSVYLAFQANRINELTANLNEQIVQLSEESNRIAERSLAIAETANRLIDQSNQIMDRSNQLLSQSNTLSDEQNRIIRKGYEPRITVEHTAAEGYHAYVVANRGNPLNDFVVEPYNYIVITMVGRGDYWFLRTLHVPYNNYYIESMIIRNSGFGDLMKMIIDTKYYKYAAEQVEEIESVLRDAFQQEFDLRWEAVVYLYLGYSNLFTETESLVFRISSGSVIRADETERGIILARHANPLDWYVRDEPAARIRELLNE